MDNQNFYGRTSKYKYKLKEEYLSDQYFLKEERKRLTLEKEGLNYLLLDSNLISATNKKNYDCKVVQCGQYLQVYKFLNKRVKKDSNLEKDVEVFIEKTPVVAEEVEYKKIEEKNIIRSKTSLQNLVKANEDIFKTFITLTFEENLQDIKQANNKLKIFRTKIKSIKKDFAYICVPEFQRRGAIHYHLITNLSYEDSLFLSLDEKKIWDRRKGKWQIFKNIKYWSYGFNSVIDLKNENVVGYLSKYMTKDIDQRLFGHRRYMYSQNLKHPVTLYLDLEDLKDLLLHHDIVNNSSVVYHTQYLSFNFDDYLYVEDSYIYDVDFTEYKLLSNNFLRSF